MSINYVMQQFLKYNLVYVQNCVAWEIDSYLVYYKMLENERDSMDEKPCFPPGFSSVENQEARAFLREKFLRVVTGIVGM